tara:strand:- start:55 stop:546 length:492 start_codon:yes stop_codon:yes gene_type:complete
MMKNNCIRTIFVISLFVISGCTIVSTSFSTAGPTLSEVDISDEFTAEANVTKIIGIDFARLLKVENSQIGAPSGTFSDNLNILNEVPDDVDITYPLDTFIKPFAVTASPHTYALKKLIDENPGYDLIITPKYKLTVNGFPPFYWTENVVVTARLGKIKEELLK